MPVGLEAYAYEVCWASMPYCSSCSSWGSHAAAELQSASHCRKRRQYAAQDVSALVTAEGVQLEAPSSDVFPLEVFDDTNYESRTHREWVPRTPGR